jgi:hypothetical protein
MPSHALKVAVWIIIQFMRNRGITMFPDPIMQCIQTLTEIFGKTKNYTIVTFPIVEIIKYNNEKEISIKLFYDFKTESFEIQAPTSKYYSKISHYDYNRMTERHWTRDKGYLFSVIGNLKSCGLWDMVSNKDFLIVNSYNKNSDPKKLLRILKAMES